MRTLANRQVHLDFHTSEQIGGVGSRFTKANFQEALQLGHLDSITVFAKCHHGLCYYPTKAGVMHPALVFDLTGALVDAAHEVGVRAPVYVTVGWSAGDAVLYPECTLKNMDGSIRMSNGSPDAPPDEPRPAVSWVFMCPSGRYARLIYDLTEELCGHIKVLDGLFYDICFGPVCYCENCLAAIKAAGLDPASEADAQIYNQMKWASFARECRRILKKSHPAATLFFNGGADIGHPEHWDLSTHLEMEDLPTTWGGYDKMPLRARRLAWSGLDAIGMTGKFHTYWGEFGGYKNPAALRYECAAMMAFGVGCSVGDQMHPDGEMDLPTYRLIGEAYEYTRNLQLYCFNTVETGDVGLWLSGHKQSDEGMANILLENQVDFQVVNPEGNLDLYKVIILPDAVYVDENLAARLKAYTANGGALLLTGQSGLSPEKDRFMLDTGAKYLGASPYDVDYIRMRQAEAPLISSPFLTYEAGQRVQPGSGAVLAEIWEPYFSRTYGHYCSHQNTPYQDRASAYPAAVRSGRTIYLAHALGRLYHVHGAKMLRDYFLAMLNLLRNEPVLQVRLPSAGRVRLADQPGENRLVLHLLYAPPLQRGRTLVIEDLPQLHDIAVSIRTEKHIRQVTLVPQNQAVPFSQAGGHVAFTVASFSAHQAVTLDY